MSNFQFLDQLPNLTSLKLHGEATSNSSPALEIPASLTQLAHLDLRGQTLSALILPPGLSTLQFLHLGQNHPLPSLVVPAGLSGLETLSFGSNPQLAQLTLSEGLSSLAALVIEGNNSWVTDLHLPAGLDSLTTLRLNAAIRRHAEDHDQKPPPPQFQSLTFGGPLPALRELTVIGAEFTNFPLPTGISEIRSITVSQAGLTEVDLPRGLGNLRSLDVSGNFLGTLNLPDGMTKLGSLDASDNGLSEFTLPADVRNLADLNLARNFLTSFAPFPRQPRLQHLDLTDNRVRTLNFGGPQPQLTRLLLRDNLIPGTLIIPAGLENLAFLDLGGNQLQFLRFAQPQPHLHTLLADSNQFTDFAFLTAPGLPTLATLDLAANDLTTMNLPGGELAPLTSLNLSANALSNLSFLAGFPDLSSLQVLENTGTHLLVPDLPQLRTLSATVEGNQPLLTIRLSGELGQCFERGAPISFPPYQFQTSIFPVNPPPREPSAPVLTGLEFLPDQSLALTLRGATGDCVLEASHDLVGWSFVRHVLGRAEGQRLVVPTTFPARYYRIRSLP